MTTAFDGHTLADAFPVRSGSMSERLADAAVPLIGGHAPSTRRGGTARRQTYVARTSDRFLARTATACLAVGGVALAVGVSTLF